MKVKQKHSWLAWVLGLTTAMAAHADDDRRMVLPQLPLYQQECAACHMAYPPNLLSAVSWQRLMQGLGQHYGVDASLDEASVQTLSQYLVTHAVGKRAVTAPPNDRITESRWFVRKHRSFDAKDWAHPQIKSAANCMACHAGAERGDFEEDRVRLPSGVGGWGRRLLGDD